jgi:hypothetical protein
VAKKLAGELGLEIISGGSFFVLKSVAGKSFSSNALNQLVNNVALEDSQIAQIMGKTDKNKEMYAYLT